MKDPECNYSHSKLEQKNSSPPTTSPPKSVTVMKGIGSVVSKPSATTGSLPSMQNDLHPSNSELAARMARIESRLVKLMLHFGINPQKETEWLNTTNT